MKTLYFGMNIGHNVTKMAYLSCCNRQKIPIPIPNQHIMFIYASQVLSVYDMNEDIFENMQWMMFHQSMIKSITHELSQSPWAVLEHLTECSNLHNCDWLNICTAVQRTFQIECYFPAWKSKYDRRIAMGVFEVFDRGGPSLHYCDWLSISAAGWNVQHGLQWLNISGGWNRHGPHWLGINIVQSCNHFVLP